MLQNEITKKKLHLLVITNLQHGTLQGQSRPRLIITKLVTVGV